MALPQNRQTLSVPKAHHCQTLEQLCCPTDTHGLVLLVLQPVVMGLSKTKTGAPIGSSPAAPTLDLMHSIKIWD
jgi:hypothetical protein